MNTLVFQVLAIAGIVIVAMALSANSTGARIVQWGLAIAIIGVLLRNQTDFRSSWEGLTHKAISATGKQTGVTQRDDGK